MFLWLILVGVNGDGEGNALKYLNAYCFVKHNESLFCFSFGILVLYQIYGGICRRYTNSTGFYVWQLLHASLPTNRLKIYLDVNEPLSSVLRQSHRVFGQTNMQVSLESVS